MTLEPSAYHIIQFSEDPYKDERINVGIVILYKGSLYIRLTNDFSRLDHIYGTVFDCGRLVSEFAAYRNRLAACTPDRCVLNDFNGLEAGRLRLSNQRLMMIDNIKDDLNNTFDYLVRML